MVVFQTISTALKDHYLDNYLSEILAETQNKNRKEVLNRTNLQRDDKSKEKQKQIMSGMQTETRLSRTKCRQKENRTKQEKRIEWGRTKMTSSLGCHTNFFSIGAAKNYVI